MRRSGFTAIECAIVAAIVLILVAIIGCQVAHYRGIHAGYVTGREYHSAWTSFIMVGKVMVPQHHPEHWDVSIAFDGKTNEWDVDQATYLQANNGLWFDADTGALTAQPVAEAK